MKTISRNNTHKKNIALNINHTIGIPLSYAAKIIDDLISILISNVLTKNQLKIKNFGVFNLKKKIKELAETQRIKQTMKFQKEMFSLLKVPSY